MTNYEARKIDDYNAHPLGATKRFLMSFFLHVVSPDTVYDARSATRTNVCSRITKTTHAPHPLVDFLFFSLSFPVFAHVEKLASELAF